jgi:hypothetical protein
MAKLDFLTRKYDRGLFLDFLRDFLTDKFKTIETEQADLGAEFQYIKKVYKLGEDQNLDLAVYEVEHLSENDPRVSLTREIFKFNKRRLVKRALIIFHSPKSANFRLSLVTTEAAALKGKKVIVTESNPRRYSYLLGENTGHKTAYEYLIQKGQIKVGQDAAVQNELFNAGLTQDEKNLLKKDLQDRFSMEVVTEKFYDGFKTIFEKLKKNIKTTGNSGVTDAAQEDFLLLFAIRIIFIGFIQKRKWIGGDDKFLKDIFFAEYKKSKDYGKDKFYSQWLKPLLFEALNQPYGAKVAYGHNKFSPHVEKALQLAPYLNGGLFRMRPGIDDKGLYLADQDIEEYFEYIFQFNFTIEENTLYDHDLELNPEFLGIIFERLVNKENGAVYTPRTEVDFMCRLSLVKWLEKVNTTKLQLKDLYELCFREIDTQRYGDFTAEQTRELLVLLGRVTICDPAVGSGAFPVGMLQILDEVQTILNEKQFKHTPLTKAEKYEQKKSIVQNSLYGVEIKEWAVWITQLRLWITLFIDAPDDLKTSLVPILPSLDFKIRQGDSLVQKIGSKMFPIQGHADLKKEIKAKIAKLRGQKAEFFQNKGADFWFVKKQETDIFAEILAGEILEKRNLLKTLKSGDVYEMQALFSEMDVPKFKQKDLFAQQIARLEIEIAELQEEKNNLRQGHPLVWNIEFAEIFSLNGGFDIVIANPPYVRQEDITDPLNKLDKAIYKTTLAEMVSMDFPDYFNRAVKVDRKSDLYAYFYIRGLRLLNENGIHTFICSNSWLDVGYGAWLQKFLLEKAPVKFIVDNHAKRSFERADVNTIISVLDAPGAEIMFPSRASGNETGAEVLEAPLVKFVAFKKPFEEVVFTENLLEIEYSRIVTKNDKYRVYPISIKDLLAEGTEYAEDENTTIGAGKYIGNKWGGKYLRAPDIYFTILEKGKDKLVKLKSIAKIRPGCYTGINDFFYIDKVVAKQFGIEKEFLTPVIRTSRSIEFSTVNVDNLDSYVLNCQCKMKELKKQQKKGILSYINWGKKQKTRERQKTNAGIFWPEVESVKRRNPDWYAIPKQNLEQAQLFMLYVINIRFLFPLTNKPVCSDRCFHRIFMNNPEYLKVMAAILFATSTAFFIQLMGRAGLGEGALKYETSDAQELLVINPCFLSKENVRELENRFNRFSERKVEDIFTECGIDTNSNIPIFDQDPKPLPDRAALDKVVFDALGLTETERKDVYRAVCQLVYERISKAGSV